MKQTGAESGCTAADGDATRVESPSWRASLSGRLTPSVPGRSCSRPRVASRCLTLATTVATILGPADRTRSSATVLVSPAASLPATAIGGRHKDLTTADGWL